MAQKLTDRSELAEAPASGDLFHVVDVSDTTDGAAGTSKKVQAQYLTISDASTTVKGKVELATDAETITGTDTVRAITPSNITAKIDTDGTLAGNLDTRIPSQKAVKTYTDSGTQTMTNKTLTSPVLTTPTIKTWDGWQSVADSWSYASASTITVPSGAASLYKKGDKIKWTQTTVKYGVVVTVADTLLTIAVNDEYTVANAAISSIYVSHSENPIGWPSYFTFSTVHGGYSSAPTGKLKYNIQGNRFICDYADATGGTSNATTTTFTVPVSPVSSISMLLKISYKDNGTNSATTGHLQCTAASATISAWTTFYQGAWTNANGKDLYFSNLQFFF